MSDKPVAGIVTAAVAVPVVALCCLGPAVLGSIAGGVLGWFGGLGPVAAIALVFGAALALYGVARRIGTRGDPAS